MMSEYQFRGFLHELEGIRGEFKRVADALSPKSTADTPTTEQRTAAALIRCAGMMASNHYRAVIGSQQNYFDIDFFSLADSITASAPHPGESADG